LSRRPVRAAELADAPVAVPLRALGPPPLGALRRLPGEPEPTDAMLVAALSAEREAAFAEARAEGLAIGRAEGRAEGLAELEGALGAMVELLGHLGRRAEDLEVDAAPALASLAVEVAARVVRAEVAARPERVVDVVRGAMRRALDRERLLARVNPEDLALCREAGPALLAQVGGVERLEFVDDARVPRGGCVLETNRGDVDATIAEQLARIHEALLSPPDEELVD
jgi:flagellar assembly protein FliH